MLVSIPSSELEIGGEKGRRALDKLKHVVSRTAAHWRPASTDESFEIVRRRLFEPVSAEMAVKRDAVIRAFHNLYLDHPADFPSETKEGTYKRRMEAAYPLHPELFDRLYQDWSTLDRFQRTRGMLKLMATVIAELWKRDDRSLMIMPGTVPIDSSPVVSQLTGYLDERWEPIIRTDVDGPTSLPLKLDQQRQNLGRYSAGRRVARTTYLGSAPRHDDRRGVDLKRIVLGCVQPGEPPGVFQDAIRHLSSEATYLYNQGAQYWYDTKQTLTRLAADRAESNWSDDDADVEIRKLVQNGVRKGPFGAVHVFPDGPGDVPDEADQVRLVVLPPTAPHNSSDETPALRAAAAILDQRQGGPRLNRNLVVYLAADKNRVPELRQAMKSVLAWQSILSEQGAEGLDLSASEIAQAETKLGEAVEAVTQRIAETFQHVLLPRQQAGKPEVTWQSTRATGEGSLPERVGRKLTSSEDLISSYSGVRVRMDLDRPEARLWDGDHIGIQKLWSYYTQLLHMPRLAGFGVLAAAISDGVAQLNWEADTFAYAERHDPEADRYAGLAVGRQVDVGLSREAVLVHPSKASTHTEQALRESLEAEAAPEAVKRELPAEGGTAAQPRRWYGRKVLEGSRAIRDFGDMVNEVAAHLDGKVTITVEINAESVGYGDRIRRTVSENATQLGFDHHEFEE